MKNYSVTFERIDSKTGESRLDTKNFEADNPGHAFYKCGKKFPGCKLIRATSYRRFVSGGEFWQEHEPPQAQPTMEAPLMEAEKREQTEMILNDPRLV